MMWLDQAAGLERAGPAWESDVQVLIPAGTLLSLWTSGSLLLFLGLCSTELEGPRGLGHSSVLGRADPTSFPMCSTVTWLAFGLLCPYPALLPASAALPACASGTCWRTGRSGEEPGPTSGCLESSWAATHSADRADGQLSGPS